MEKEQKILLQGIEGILRTPDDKCPFPYIQLDCTMEEFAEKIGAISLQDFMRKVGDKYGV